MYCGQDKTDSKDTNEMEKNSANDPGLMEYNKKEPINENTASNVLTREQV